MSAEILYIDDTWALLKVFDMKRVTTTNYWGITSKVSISTRIIKTKDNRWSIYVRET